MKIILNDLSNRMISLYIRVVRPVFIIMLLALSAAAGRGKLDECVFLLEQGAAITQPNRRGVTPIYTAVKHGHTQVGSLIHGLNLSVLQFDFHYRSNF